MSFNQNSYISDYNKNNYKMFQFRVKKTDEKIIDFLEGQKSKNGYILSLIENDMNPQVYTIKELKELIKPVLHRHNIYEIYLFGSYARGEANKNSDVDIYCEKGDIKTLIDQGFLFDELKEVLNREVDIVFIGSKMDKIFEEELMKDIIKI